jgi:hypothetical protein
MLRDVKRLVLVAATAAALAALLLAKGGTPPPADDRKSLAHMKLASVVVIEAGHEEITDLGLILDPVASDFVPLITPTQALFVAEEQGLGTPPDADRSLTLASFTDTEWRPSAGDDSTADDGPPLYSQVPAWIVTYRNVCVPNSGPAETDAPISGDKTAKQSDCAGTELNVVVDATTGSYLEAYSYR